MCSPSPPSEKREPGAQHLRQDWVFRKACEGRVKTRIQVSSFIRKKAVGSIVDGEIARLLCSLEREAEQRDCMPAPSLGKRGCHTGVTGELLLPPTRSSVPLVPPSAAAATCLGARTFPPMPQTLHRPAPPPQAWVRVLTTLSPSEHLKFFFSDAVDIEQCLWLQVAKTYGFDTSVCCRISATVVLASSCHVTLCLCCCCYCLKSLSHVRPL